MKNLNEFKKLIERYESVTLEEIEKVWFIQGSLTANQLTGFGKIHTCPLCGYKGGKFTLCKDCVWAYNNEGIRCMNGANGYTFRAIKFAENPEELLQAFRMRAKRMRERLMELGINY